MPIGYKHAGWLYMKSTIKLFAIIFLMIELIQFNPIIALIVVFISYFTLPTSYSTDEPYKASEAWFRMLFGYIIAVMMLFTFSNIPLDLSSFIPIVNLIFVLTLGGPTNPAIAFFFLSLAFFFTLPEREIKTIGGMSMAIIPALGAATGAKIDETGRMFFTLFMIISALYVIFWLNVQEMQLIMALILGISWFMGNNSGRENRPYLGIFVISISLFVFSFAYTSTFGTAVFGAWWPTVQGAISPIITPIGQALGDSYTAASDSYLLLTCPTCYYEQQALKNKAESEIEGTPDAVEVVSFNTIASFIDWKTPFVGQLLIENKGEYSANNLDVVFDTPMISNPLAGTNEQTKEPFDGACLASDSFNITSCTDDDVLQADKKTCKWPEFTKGDKKLIEFEINFKNQGDSCKQYAGNLTNINFKLKYDYQVYVKQDISIMDPKYRQQKLLNNELQLKTIISEYVGGPLKAAISTLPQPLDATKKFSIFGSITKATDSTTSISDIKYNVQILTPPGERKECATSASGCVVPPSSELFGNLCIMNCSFADADFGDKTKIAQKVLVAQYNIGTDAKEKTFTIVGQAKYHVEEDSPHDIPFAFVSEE